MSDKYFKKYESRELFIAENFIDDTEWLSMYVAELKKDNTPFHDLIIVSHTGERHTVEIKEDEYYWYSKTGNIGLDYLSAFKFKDSSRRLEWLKNNYWIKSEFLDEFKNDIEVLKFGKLFTCDADFQLFVVLDNEKIVFSKLYSNQKLKSPEFVRYLETNYNLRVNKKSDYKLHDNWDSAAYFVNPNEDRLLQNCEVKNIDDIIKKV